MLYSFMAMIWVEIVLHKDVDWHTIIWCNLKDLTCKDKVIDTTWLGPSECMPKWSNRSYGQQPSVVLLDAEDEWLDDNDVDDAPPTVTFGKRHKRAEDRKAIQYKHQLQDVMRRSK